jgi:hypothetical protein
VRADYTDPDEDRLTQGLRRIQHLNGPREIKILLGMIEPAADYTNDSRMDEETRRLATMLNISMWGKDGLPRSPSDGLRRIKVNAVTCGELRNVLLLNLNRVESVAPVLDLPFLCPLTVHARYTRDEILAALGHWTVDRHPDMREGVLHIPEIHADVFMITLNKTESDYSPTTMYEDYAVNEHLFHWQSQSTTSDDSPTGRRYVEHALRRHSILLFAREHKKVNGLSVPYYFLGPASYQSHTGSRPMSILWRLRHHLPAKLLRRMARLAVG